MPSARAISIRTRLTALSLLCTLAPIGGALWLVASRNLRDIREEMVSSSVMVGYVVGEYSASAMAFEDRPAAVRTLEGLTKVENVMAAGLYDNSGKLFASYVRPVSDKKEPPPADRLVPPSEAKTEMGAGHVSVMQPVLYRGTRYGTLTMKVCTSQLQNHLRAYLWSMVLLGVGALLAALLLAFMLERMISRPLLGLAGAARTIAATEDYSMRAKGGGNDEMGLLATAFNQMLAEVDRRQHQAQQAIQVRDDFLSVASHELKTPLTSLMLQVQGLVMVPPRGEVDAPRVGASLQMIQRQVTRLDKLIGNLLDVSRMAAGRLMLDLAEVDLSVVAAEVASHFEAELQRQRCTLERHLDPAVLGRWDALRIDQVVTNLLSNAIKYGAGQPIELRVEQHETVARLIIRDHGIGIAPEDHERVFDRFERAVSLSYGGLGLGLYITRQIVLAHGGTIRVESALRAGSTFIVELPRVGPL